jgi:hypothetical protein
MKNTHANTTIPFSHWLNGIANYAEVEALPIGRQATIGVFQGYEFLRLKSCFQLDIEI